MRTNVIHYSQPFSYKFSRFIYMLRYVPLLLILICGTVGLHAQSANWAKDSLAIYDKKIQSALEKKDYNEVHLLISVIFNKGYKALDPLFYNYFINATKDQKYKDLPDLLGNIYNCIGSFEYSKSNMEGA